MSSSSREQDELQIVAVDRKPVSSHAPATHSSDDLTTREANGMAVCAAMIFKTLEDNADRQSPPASEQFQGCPPYTTRTHTGRF